MSEIAAVGLDPAKSVIQVRAVDRYGRPLRPRKRRRSQLLDDFTGLPAYPVA